MLHSDLRRNHKLECDCSVCLCECVCVENVRRTAAELDVAVQL